MTELEPLIDTMTPFLRWHRARVVFLAQFLVALIRVRTVNLTEMATAFCGSTKPASSYRRIQRFFKDFEVDLSLIASLVTRLLPLPTQWILCLDRTNWKLGAANLNILVLAVAFRGMAVPLYWSLLDKRGNSDTRERMRLLRKFLRQFGAERIQCLTADREFIGGLWLRFLKKHHIAFRLRIRRNTRIPLRRGGWTVPASRYARTVPVGACFLLPTPRRIGGVSVYVVGLRLPQDDLILLTDAFPETAVEDYRRRWEIETVFGGFKTHGFHLEDTHLTMHARVSKLLALLTIALCWCYHLGLWQDEITPIRRKRHQRLAVSLFRYGLDLLRTIVLNFSTKHHDFIWAVKFLSCT